MRLVVDFEAQIETTTSSALEGIAEGDFESDRKALSRRAKSMRMLLFFTIDVAASLLLALFPTAYLLSLSPTIGVYVPLTAGLSLLPTFWMIRVGEWASLDGEEAGRTERWHRSRHRHELSGKSAQALSLVFLYGLLVWGAFQVRDGAMVWPELLTVLLIARIIYGPLTSIAGVAVRASHAVPDSLALLQTRNIVNAARPT